MERLYRLMFGRVGNRPDAEDLTAEVFLAAVPRVDLTASAGEVRAYLLTVARTVLADHWRRVLGHQVTTIDPAALAEAWSTATSPGSQPVESQPPGSQEETAERVRRVLAELPERYQAILRLRFLQAESVREAARQMGITVANAKVLQYRALRQAARLLDTDGGGEST
ncbi:MAG: sigma-70 family RNA polymerase sigma factor [Micromonosporaceae bacterium]|nr:sigma-70 family RNA polymerase sigma factor [Micromonosporaceae bacterium]